MNERHLSWHCRQTVLLANSITSKHVYVCCLCLPIAIQHTATTDWTKLCLDLSVSSEAPDNLFGTHFDYLSSVRYGYMLSKTFHLSQTLYESSLVTLVYCLSLSIIYLAFFAVFFFVMPCRRSHYTKSTFSLALLLHRTYSALISFIACGSKTFHNTIKQREMDTVG